jgi:hypothetical protein
MIRHRRGGTDAFRASAGGKHGDDGRVRPELTSFLPAGGDHQIAACPAVNLRHCRIMQH